VTIKFWKDPPIKPLNDWRTYLIGVPVIFSATGAGLFMALSFSFTELDAISQPVKIGLVIVAAFSTAIGSAFGSIGSGIEIYRKAFEKTAIWLDWTSLALSVAATLGGFIMGFAALLGAVSQWSEAARRVGPLILSALVALDAAGDLIELGGLFAAYNVRYAAWDKERATYNDAHNIVPVEPEPDLVRIDPRWPAADINDVKALRLNGERADLDRYGLEQALARQFEKRMPDVSPSTVGRWVKLAKNGA